MQGMGRGCDRAGAGGHVWGHAMQRLTGRRGGKDGLVHAGLGFSAVCYILIDSRAELVLAGA